jgi:magnesium-transporting ATPase (P-type)
MKPIREHLLDPASKEDAEIQPESASSQSGDDGLEIEIVDGGGKQDEKDSEPSRQNAHVCRTEVVVKLVNTNIAVGLTASEAKARLDQYGLNKLAEPPADTLLQRLWRQINQILIWILLVACIVSAAVQSWPEFGLILAVVVINVLLGVLQEGKASKATAALRSMLSSKASVIRDGNRLEIDAQEVVPGDIVFIESGNKVPADIRLFEVSNLSVQEAMLTGESLPVSKITRPVALNVGLGDRKNMCYSATLVVKGQGTGICVATGDKTEIGRIAELVSAVKETKTNLLMQIDAFGRWIGFVVLPIAVATFLIALLTPVQISNNADGTASSSNSSKASEAFVIAVAIAVSMIPAGLPASELLL